MDDRTPLLGLSRELLAERLGPYIDRPYRVDQIYRAVYQRGVGGFEAMTDLGQELRRSLSTLFRIDRPEIARRSTSRDGTEKYLLRLDDGATVEAVDIPEGGRRTLCISSQAGCPLGCRFCVTGFWGAGRNLSPGEILGQVMAITGGLWHKSVINLVFMGMGEPLLNLEAVRAALSILAEWFPLRRITVSTAGIVPGIDAMASWSERPNLAVSLHAPENNRRSDLMPVNRTHPIESLMASLRRYPVEKRRRITIEYILIHDFNDASDDADALADLLRGLRCKVNLLSLNEDPVLGPEMRGSEPAAVVAFQERLERRGVRVTVRKPRGNDVEAGCGRLRAAERPPRGFPDAQPAERQTKEKLRPAPPPSRR